MERWNYRCVRQITMGDLNFWSEIYLLIRKYVKLLCLNVRPWEILPRLQRNVVMKCHIVCKDVQILIFANVQISWMMEIEILCITCLVLLKGLSVIWNVNKSVWVYCYVFINELWGFGFWNIFLLSVFHFCVKLMGILPKSHQL